MIYDCFIFYNELEILEIRLNELYPYVDKFVLVEATKTLRGQDKELYFEKNKQHFSKFSDKIEHIVVDDMPIPNQNIRTDIFEPEKYMIKNILCGLKNCKDDDIIIFGYSDEIAKHEMVQKFCSKEIDAQLRFGLLNSFYYFNDIVNPIGYTDNHLQPWYSSYAIPYKQAKIGNLFEIYHAKLDRVYPIKFIPDRNIDDMLKNYAGWHFSWLGGPQQEIRKLTWAHAPTGKDGVHVGVKTKVIDINIPGVFPQYLVDNQKEESFKKYIKEFNN